MAVSTTTAPVVSPRSYDQLPRGVQPFFVEVRLTHDATAGQAIIDVTFNPDSRVDFQPYVMINLIALSNSATAGNTSVQGQTGEWENSVSRSILLTNLVEAASQGTQYIGESNTWYSLGRVKKGTAGSLRFITTNTNGCVQDLTVTGLVSDKPFLAPDFMRV